MKSTIGIYKITNPNNEVYIGGTRNLRHRLNQYRCGAKKTQRLIYKSIQKFGWGSHVFEVVHDLPIETSPQLLDNYEQTYMEFYKEAGYKMLNIRGCGKRGKHNPESLKLMAKVKTGKTFPESARKKLSEAHSGGKHWGAKKVIDMATGNVYDCGRIAAGFIGMNYTTLRNQLNGQRPNRTTLKYL